MKNNLVTKFLGIFVLGLLWSNVGIADSKKLKYYIKHKNLGLDKKEISLKIIS